MLKTKGTHLILVLRFVCIVVVMQHKNRNRAEKLHGTILCCLSVHSSRGVTLRHANGHKVMEDVVNDHPDFSSCIKF